MILRLLKLNNYFSFKTLTRLPSGQIVKETDALNPSLVCICRLKMHILRSITVSIAAVNALHSTIETVSCGS